MAARIEVAELVKEFRIPQRREGVRGALQNLFYRKYQTVRAVDSISFEIPAGDMVGYIGPNGAGKSTTIKMLTGILMPTSGRVISNGFRPFEERSRYTKTIGVVFGQRTQLWWDIAVIESFRLLKKIYDVSDADYEARMKQFDEVLELKRYLNTPVRKLSLGERMRCDVAASLIHNPPLLFLDEPTIGLDIVAKDHIRAFLKQVNQQYGTTILLTTHDLADIEELCRRLMVIDRGKLLFDGPLEELKRRLWRETSVKFDFRDREQAQKLAAMSIPHVSVERCSELTCRLTFPREAVSTAEVIRRVVNSVEVLDISIEEQSIEEVVKQIYTGQVLQEAR
ncbi:MAG: ATP-binding cassette domain-containing protein [Bryobacteraceae bacterium]|nr:ATP-binding cassette domain-containing protein [Bryobacteraceae bacterium]MDW8376576.1 ATP-binding cassette domain-containing protein [Bryobacterales bacterium]